MSLFIEALNKPVDAYKRRNSRLPWILVVITIIMVTVFDPILQYFANNSGVPVSIDILRITWLSLAGVMTYLAICAIFWMVCKAFGSKTQLPIYIRTWGISYFPTILCAIIVTITENFFYVFWNSTIWVMVFNIVFGGILIWKTTLYIVFLKEVAKLKGGKLAGAFLVCGAAILLLAYLDAYIGLKTPIL